MSVEKWSKQLPVPDGQLPVLDAQSERSLRCGHLISAVVTNLVRSLGLSGVLALLLVCLLCPSPAMAEACPNERLRAEDNSMTLPECRAYELVTPFDKNGQSNPRFSGLKIEGGLAPDGNAFNLNAFTTLPGSNVGGSSSFIVRRESGGWAAAPLVPVADEQPGEAENLNTGLLFAVGPNWSTVFFSDQNDLVSSDGDANISDVFAANEDGSLAWISQGPAGGVGVAPARPASSLAPALVEEVGGATPNLSHVIFQTPWGSLLSEDTHTAGSEIYDRVDESNTKLVGVLPEEVVPECGAKIEGVTELPAEALAAPTVIFESPDPGSTTAPYPGIPICSSGNFTPPQLYARIDDKRTIDVSAPAVGSPEYGHELSELQQAHYIYATPQTTKIFFTSKGALTADANTDGDTVEDLYEYDLANGDLTDLSSAGLDNDVSGSQVQGVGGISENGEVVYFVAKGKLTSQATDGEENLYVSNKGEILYIAMLNASDEAVWSGVNERVITPDGSRFLFASRESLTGYSNAGYSETYLYDLGTAETICVSCGIAGTTAGGLVSGGAHDAGDLTADGDTVFFDSMDALTPGSTLGSHNVYEWHEGTLELIMAGGESLAEKAPGAVSLLTATANGSDVLFATELPLVSQDRDGGERNFYDARIDGGFPVPVESASCATAEACRGGSSIPPSLQSVGSLVPGVAPALTAGPSATVPPATKPETRAQKLKKALKSCGRDERKAKRVACQKRVRQKYGLERSNIKVKRLDRYAK